MPSMASQNRSSSALVSDSVGSIIRVPGTGQLMVGGWKPQSMSRLAMSSTVTPARSLRGRVSMMGFMRDTPVPAAVEHGIGAGEPLRDVVGAEDRDARRLGEPSPSHHETIAPRDRQDRCRAKGCGRDGQRAVTRLGLSGKERGEMRLDADRPDAWATAPMGDAESLMQIEVAHVGANVTRPCQSNERVHIGAVEINWPPFACVISQISRTVSSNTPWVDG